MRKKIVIITGVFLPEPIVSARLMADLAEELAKEYDVTVLRPHPSRPMGFKVPPYDFSDKPYKVVELDAYVCPRSSLLGRFRESISYGNACIRYMNPIKEQLSFVYNGAWHLFGRKNVAEFCRKNHIPNMTPVQDIYPESLLSKLPKIKMLQWMSNRLLMPLDMKTLHAANRIHTISTGMRDYLAESRGLEKDRFVVVRNWQDEREFTFYIESHHEVEEHPFTFMYMGNVGALAGLEVVIEAFAKAGLKNARLVIAGSGSAKASLMELANKYPQCDIQFRDVPFGKVPHTQAMADVMVLPVKKGFARSSIPSKMPAYMFSQKPILASVDNDSDSAECIRRANAGWVCEPENVQAIASTMKRIVALNIEEIRAMGVNGYNYAIQDFSRSVNLKKLAEACITVIELGK